jgi:membrane protease subunit HflC
MSSKKFFFSVALAVSLLLSHSLYIQDHREIALITQIGKVVRESQDPGLKFKLPFLQEVNFFDKRLQTIKFNMSEHSNEVVAFDQKTMQLDAFAVYKIINPRKFYESAKTDGIFRQRMRSITESSIREVIGRVYFKDVLGAKRNEIRENIIKLVNNDVAKFGVHVNDVRIIRVNLPDKARNAVYARMRSEREKEAKEIRAVGHQQAEIIKAEADKDQSLTIAQAKKTADILKGEGEAAAIKIYAGAYGRDTEFFERYKTLEVYKKAFNKNSKLVLSTDNDFLKFFKKQ